MRFVLAALLLAASLAHAQEPRKYAVLSLVGDALLVVQREMTTGTRVDRNTHTRVDMPNPALDNIIVGTVDRELVRAVPGTTPVLLAARRAEFFAIQSRALDEGTGIQNVVEALRDVVAPTKATHLVLVTKHRAQAKIALVDGKVGSGLLEGLGFYIDPGMIVTNRETGIRTEGFIAPYAYLVVSLVELPSGRVLARSVVTETASASAVAQASFTPWVTLTADQKVGMLDGLIKAGVQRAVPEVLGRSKS
jgi:hypothetical protein